jgi:signal transduction histidine kinase
MVTQMKNQDPSKPMDSSQMRIAIQNLIDNGLRYTPTGGTITVRAYPAEHAVVIEVEDSGEGIAESDLTRIFDRFYRAEKHRPTTGGTGLGLAITKRIVELHGATIVATSPRGALFRIHFPVSTAS